ncbi:MAG TPA: M56 family metallopeptidase, partial [Polyangiales bacterium]|nr:M56 family metallopeptidase [Polyangiales bacterium]
MNVALHIAFNLVVNSIGSFLLGLGVAAAAIACFRIEPGRVRTGFWMLPFAKVIWDAAAGIPRGSFLWQKLNGAHQDLGVFKIGLGASRFSPQLTAELGALWHGRQYTQSAAELLDTALSRHIAPTLPSLLIIVWAIVSALRLARRAMQTWLFAREMRALRSDSQLAEIRHVGKREVPVFVHDEYRGAPFACGCVHPFVVLPSSLSCQRDRREAVIAHELSHIEHRDLWLDALLRRLSDVLWFVPGCAWLLRRIRADMELRADEATVASGIDRIALAEVLVSVAESMHPSTAGMHLVPRRSLLAQRVERLVS